MGLKETFQSAASTAFNIFADLAKSATYVESADDGFGVVTTTNHSLDIIFANLEEVEINQLSFRDKIQPTDVIGLIEAQSLTVSLQTHNDMLVESNTFKIIAFDLDPAEALYIVLLRA